MGKQRSTEKTVRIGKTGVFYYKNGVIVKEIADGILVEEITEAFGLMKFLYTTFLGKLIRRFLRKRLPARIVGWWQNTRLSRRSITPFIKRHAIDMFDFQEPAGGYQSFNDFFVRKLKVGVRKIDDSLESAVAPCDGKVFAFDAIQDTQEFIVKGVPFCLADLFDDEREGTSYCGGSMLLFRLAPYDYHRFHFPLDCIPTFPKRIAGCYESVNPFIYNLGVQPLTINERHVILLKTKFFNDVAFFVIGAMFVGAIDYTHQPGQPAGKGIEMGYFSFGGSSLIVLFKKNIAELRPDLVINTQHGYETAVLMGEMVAKQKK